MGPLFDQVMNIADIARGEVERIDALTAWVTAEIGASPLRAWALQQLADRRAAVLARAGASLSRLEGAP